MKLGSYNYGTREATDTHGVSLGTFASMVEAEKAMGAARLPYSFWGYEQVSPIPLLKDLYAWVIAQNEKRLPKWKFKLTSNLAVQIQPKLTRAHALLFECIAIQTENPSLKLFTEPKSLRGQSYWRMKSSYSTTSRGPSGRLSLRALVADMDAPRAGCSNFARALSRHCIPITSPPLSLI